MNSSERLKEIEDYYMRGHGDGFPHHMQWLIAQVKKLELQNEILLSTIEASNLTMSNVLNEMKKVNENT